MTGGGESYTLRMQPGWAAPFYSYQGKLQVSRTPLTTEQILTI